MPCMTFDYCDWVRNIQTREFGFFFQGFLFDEPIT